VRAAPDFASAVAGYRAWQLGAGGVLFPLALPAAPPWEPAVNRARCFAGRRHEAHAAPATHCTCGLHALHDPNDGRLKLGHPAVGAIAAWGEIEVYAAGLRAEYASVIALAHEPSRSTGPPARLREAARRYGVRLVPLADLEAEASEFTPFPCRTRSSRSARRDRASRRQARRPCAQRAISPRPAQAPAHSPEVTAAGVDAEGNAHHRLHPCFAGKKLGDLVVVEGEPVAPKPSA
jgi:hypothetical protein